jgi:Fe-S-cluster-containing dehydrogenase component
MRNLVHSDVEKCVGCNRCTGVCPIEIANIAYANENEDIRVRMDPDKCIACGACISVCCHGARYYEDDTEKFFADLSKGVSISLLVAPASRTNNPELGRLYALLKQLGVAKLYDVSLGADICTWAYIRHIEKNHPGPMITQPCPVIVNYILKYNNDLLKYLSPVQSPILSLAIYMRKYDGVKGPIAAMSPCIAKTNEFDATGLISYNITFKKLWEYIESNKLKLPDETADFEYQPSAMGRIFPMPGGLRDNVEFYLGKTMRIDRSEGPSRVYEDLDEFGRQPKENLPALFDVLNCQEGCNLGPGCRPGRNVFEVNTIMEAQRLESPGGRDRAYVTELYESFDKTLKLSDFLRRYTPERVTIRHVSEREIEDVFKAMHKDEDWEQQYDCGACGSKSCTDMARKIALGVNLPSNCVLQMRRNLHSEFLAVKRIHEDVSENTQKIVKYFDMFQNCVERISQQFDSVTQAIKQYGEMANSIDFLANHITIIALNAKIEAARAGNAGKSFTVVAEEIHNLARQCKETVKAAQNTSEESARAASAMTEAVNDIGTSMSMAMDLVEKIAQETSSLEEETIAKQL